MPRPSLKKTGVYVVRILLLVLAMLGFLAWLLGTESALRWGAQQAVRLSDGKLALHAVHGSVYGPLRIEALSFQTDDKRFEVKEATLDWVPRALLDRRLKISWVALQELRIVEIRPSAEPLVLPETLHLPLTLSAPAISVERVVLKMAGTEYVLSGIDLGVDGSSDSYRLNLRSMASEWGKAEGEMKLGDTRPFNVTAHAILQQVEGGAYRAEVDVSGHLAQMIVTATASVFEGQAELNSTLRPFEKFPLGSTRILASSINPAKLRQDLPQADLSADISIERQGAQGLEGNILLRNMLPGAWDQNRLPVREMAARFAGQSDHLDLNAMHLDLGEAGEFKGDGQVRGQHLQLNLTTASFNPQGVHGKMRSMRLAGSIRLQAGQESQELLADLRYQRYQLHLDVHLQDEVVELRKATVQSGTGNLSLQGTLALEGDHKFQMTGALQKFNPADFGDYPVARINASFSGTGQLAEQPQAALKFALTDSQFRRQPLSGQGTLSVSATHIWNSEIMLRLARNRLELKGALGSPGDRLDFKLEADNLAMLDPELSGQVHASGTLEGKFSALSGNFDASARDLAWRKHYHIASLQASGRLDKGNDGPLTLEATLRNLTTPELHLDQADVNAQGTRGKHTLQFLAKNPDLDVRSRFAGGWRDASGWSGQVLELDNHGRHALALKSPAQLELARQHLLLKDVQLDLLGGKVVLHQLAYDAGQIASRGEFKGLPLAGLQGFVKQTADLKTDLTFGGDWQINAREELNGHVTIWREQGDVSLPTVPGITLGLQRINLKVEVVNNQLQAWLDAAGARLGSLRANVQGMLSRSNGIWGSVGQIVSRGEFKGLPLANFRGFSEQTADLKTNLTFGGDWQLTVRDEINGHAALWREQGDVTLPTVPNTTLGLQRIHLQVDAVNSQLQGRLEAAGTRLGSLKADAQSMLSRRDGVWGIAGDEPLRASADLAIESLAWIGPLMDRTGALAFDGVLKAKLHADGSFAQPKLAGTLSGDRFTVALPLQGLRFKEGSFQAELQDSILHLKNLKLRGGDGSLSAEGRLALQGESPELQLALKADKLEVVSRPDRQLILSGNGNASVAGKKVRVAAKLKADRGVIELPKGDAPTPSDDVVVLSGAKTMEKKPSPYAATFDLDLDLGEHFFVKGKGLDAQLGGNLKLASVTGAVPTSRGNIRVVKGTYWAYGQRLEIERGILNFQGPVDNPGLNIVALRKNQTVEAGVAVTGTAQAPRVNLVSNPSVPDSEKLSWLVLGHGIDDSSSQEFSALQAAAGALLAAGDSITLQQRIAYAAGLEEVSLKGAGGLEGTVLSLGKRLSSRAYLSYEQGLTGADTLVRINYTLTKRLSVRAQAGATAAVDLFYTFSFD